MFDTISASPKYAVCIVPVSPMRKEPAHRSEMVSQQLFGECCIIIEEAKDNWLKIKSLFDGYEGWCQDNHIITVNEEIYLSETNLLTADWTNEVSFNGQKMIVPIACSFPAMKEGIASWDKYQVSFNGSLENCKKITREETDIARIAKQFLNTSYLWGGKSIFGIDCSGFTQTVYKFLDFQLLRDAYQQASQGEGVGFLQEAKCGDLAFFDNSEGRITHVGIMLNDHEIIHSSGKVRIDKIDNQGIINQDNLTRTHQLRLIKRYF